jgi:four helix bundle protein
MDLAFRIYIITRKFPQEEKFGIISQMRRAAYSVPSNIAEGQARRTTGEFSQALGIAKGSLAELETFLQLSERLEFLSREECSTYLASCAELNKMLHALMKAISNSR